MKLQILQENFAKAVNQAARFTTQRAQLPILGNILLTASKTKLDISSTNLEISIATSLTAKIDKEGEISIPSKIIGEIVSNLPKETLNIEAEKEHLKISSASYSSTVLGMNATDFPKIPRSVNKTKAFALPVEEFTKALAKVIFAVSIDETRPVLTGIFFTVVDGKLALVATDGFRLSRFQLQNVKLKIKNLILPRTILGEVGRISEGEEILFEVQEKEKQVVFLVGDTVISSRLIEGEFPDYEKIIPKSASVKINVDKEELLRAVKLAAPFARDNANIVKLGVRSEGLVISAESSSGGNQETKIDAKVEAEGPERPKEVEWEMAFNYKFLEDFLGSVEGEEVRIELTSTDKAGVFIDPKDENYLHLIMPVRIQN